MQKVAGILIALTLWGNALAVVLNPQEKFDPVQIVNSAAALEGAVSALIDSVVTSYIPGYGLHISGTLFDTGENVEPVNKLNQLMELVEGLSGTIQGLDKNDFVSVSIFLTYYQDTTVYGSNLVVKLKPDRPNTLEAWENNYGHHLSHTFHFP